MIDRSTPRRGARLTVGMAMLAAAFTLGISSSAFAAAPENTALPTISPTQPYASQTAQATPGTWTGEPTSFTYSWKVCNGETCELTGSTGLTYSPVKADVGKRLRFDETATNAAGSTTAESKLTSPVRESLNWYTCGIWGGPGVYEDASCSKKGGSNPYSWLRSPTTTFKTASTSPYYISYVYVGIQAEIQCSSMQGEGKLLSTESGAKIEEYNSTLSACFVTKPAGKGCKLANNHTLVLNSLKGQSPEYPAALKPELKITPSFGETLATYSMEGCSVPAFNGPYTLKGWFPVQVNNANSTISTSGMESKGKLKLNGQSTSIEGGSTIVGSAGEYPLKLDTAP